ncbi:hypothetical protein GCM10009759_19080 [Kitasatospora saccharophila]|uniref:Uncharacterized protein n=1 Tax=Kitasatospora saccharophila TaxID=407973 RepID=A0ABN2WIR9_9ACTN
MSELVEYYPHGVYGLHWEATVVDAEEEIRGIVLAEAEDGRIALGHIEDRGQVVFLTRDELAGLRDALASGDLDHLMAGSPGLLHPPLVRPPREEPFREEPSGEWPGRPFPDWSALDALSSDGPDGSGAAGAAGLPGGEASGALGG